MSRTFHHGERKIRVRAIRKDPPDLRKLARALIALVEAEAEAEAEEQARKKRAVKHRSNGTSQNADAKNSDGGS